MTKKASGLRESKDKIDKKANGLRVRKDKVDKKSKRFEGEKR